MLKNWLFEGSNASLARDSVARPPRSVLSGDSKFAWHLAETASARTRSTLIASSQVESNRRRRTLARFIEARNAARKAKDFEEADRIRDELAKMGVVVKDTKDGTTLGDRA